MKPSIVILSLAIACSPLISAQSPREVINTNETLNAEVKRQQARIFDLRQKAQDSAREISRLTAERDELRAMIAELSAERDNSRAVKLLPEIDEAIARRDSLQGVADGIERSLQLTRNTIIDLTNQIKVINPALLPK